MPEHGTKEPLFVVTNPETGQLSPPLIPDRYPVVLCQRVARTVVSAIVSMGIGDQGIDPRRFLHQIERVIDPLVIQADRVDLDPYKSISHISLPVFSIP
jgi:hypothetical protein